MTLIDRGKTVREIVDNAGVNISFGHKTCDSEIYSKIFEIQTKLRLVEVCSDVSAQTCQNS